MPAWRTQSWVCGRAAERILSTPFSVASFSSPSDWWKPPGREEGKPFRHSRYSFNPSSLTRCSSKGCAKYWLLFLINTLEAAAESELIRRRRCSIFGRTKVTGSTAQRALEWGWLPTSWFWSATERAPGTRRTASVAGSTPTWARPERRKRKEEDRPWKVGYCGPGQQVWSDSVAGLSLWKDGAYVTGGWRNRQARDSIKQFNCKHRGRISGSFISSFSPLFWHFVWTTTTKKEHFRIRFMQFSETCQTNETSHGLALYDLFKCIFIFFLKNVCRSDGAFYASQSFFPERKGGDYEDTISQFSVFCSPFWQVEISYESLNFGHVFMRAPPVNLTSNSPANTSSRAHSQAVPCGRWLWRRKCLISVESEM